MESPTQNHAELFGNDFKNHFFSFNGRTALDSEFLSLTLGMDDIDKALLRVKRAFTRGKLSGKAFLCEENVSISEDLSLGLKIHKYGPLSMGFAFSHLSSKAQNLDLIEVPWYYNIASWEGYREYLASGSDLNRPVEFVLKYREMIPLIREDL